MNEKEVNNLLQLLLSQQSGNEAKKLSGLIQGFAGSSDRNSIDLYKSASKACVILGMHRSGTSALAGLLNIMGLHAGEESELLPPDNDNPKGYFERTDIIKLNALLLESQQCNWHTGLDHFSTTWKPEIKSDFEIRSSKIAQQLDSTNKTWLLKDPRLCLTFSAWRDIIPNAIPILTYRDPLEVATSLHKRNQFSMPFALALWEKYTLESLQSTSGMDRLIVPYQQLITDPIGVVSYLYNELTKRGVTGLIMPQQSQIFNFVDPNLNRSKKDASDRSLLTEQQLQLLNCLESKSFEHIPSLSDNSIQLLKNHM